MGSKSHGQQPLFNEGYVGHFDRLRVDIKAHLLALAVIDESKTHLFLIHFSGMFLTI